MTVLLTVVTAKGDLYNLIRLSDKWDQPTNGTVMFNSDDRKEVEVALQAFVNAANEFTR